MKSDVIQYNSHVSNKIKTSFNVIKLSFDTIYMSFHTKSFLCRVKLEMLFKTVYCLDIINKIQMLFEAVHRLIRAIQLLLVVIFDVKLDCPVA